MKLNRTTLIAAAVTAIASLAVGAVAATQTKPGGKGDHHRGGCHRGMMGKAIGAKLNLTDAQKEKLKAIRSDARAKAKAIFGNESLEKEAKRTQLKAVREAAKLQVEQVLTQDQKNQISKMREEAKARRAARQAAPRTTSRA